MFGNLVVIATDGSGTHLRTPDPPLSIPASGLDFSWDPDSAGITHLTNDGTLWHVTVGGVATQLPGSAITEFARQDLP